MFITQIYPVYAQQDTQVSLRIYSNTSWQGIIGPSGNQNSINGYGDVYKNMDCNMGDSYSVSVQLPTSALTSQYVVINLYDNGNIVRVASAQGPNSIASFSGQCDIWKSYNFNNGLISVQTDQSSYKYGDTIHMYANLIHVDSPNLNHPIGKFKIISSADNSILFEKSETSGCCIESVDIRGSLWKKDTPFWAIFEYGSPTYYWVVYTPIHILGFDNQSTSTQSSLTQVESISTHTNKTSYEYGDFIFVTGKVNPVIPNQNVTLNFYANGQWSSTMLATPSTDGSYSSTFFMNIPASQGNITITSTYGGSVNQTIVHYDTLPQTSQMHQQSIPEFGPITEVIITIAISAVLVLQRKLYTTTF